MIDTSKIIYVPRSVKFLVVFTMVMILGASIYFTYYYMSRGDNPDWVIVTLSAAQISASGLMIFVLLIFAERHTNEKVLKKQVEHYTQTMLPEAIKANSVASEDNKSIFMNVKYKGQYGPLLHQYKVFLDTHPKDGITFSFLFNLKRFTVYLYLSLDDKKFKSLEDVEQHFAHGFKVARSLGYICDVAESEEGFIGKRCYVLSFTQSELGDEFTSKPVDKLFFAQDISEMLKWYLTQKVNGGLKLL